MQSLRPNAIVADGRARVLTGSAREASSRMRARLMRRTAPLFDRASLRARLMLPHLVVCPATGRSTGAFRGVLLYAQGAIAIR